MTTSHAAPGRRIVVGVDGSPQSERALRWAAHFAAMSRAAIVVVATWQYPPNFGWSVVPYGFDPEQDMTKAVTAAIDNVFGPDRPTDLAVIVREGHPATVLLDQSADALLLVVGSRGHGGFAGLLLGSVSAAVAEHATVPVVVVHGNANPPEDPS